jgi:Periplasmic binding protein
MKIWEEETNAKGGLLGRPVKLIYYDDQSNPSTVPGIYTKLLDVDKVETAESTTRNASSSKSPRGNVGYLAMGPGCLIPKLPLRSAECSRFHGPAMKGARGRLCRQQHP